MVIALVGRAFSRKSKIAEELLNYFDGGFELLRPYTTEPLQMSELYQFIPEHDLRKYRVSDIVSHWTDDDGLEYFTFRHQYRGRKGVIWVIDDPKMLRALRNLNVPYAVVYVDCSYGRILSTAKYMGVPTGKVKARLDRLCTAFKWFQRRLEFSCYINTSTLSPQQLILATRMFAEQVSVWMTVRQYGVFQMPTIAGLVNDGWLQTAREVGWFMVEIKNAKGV